jgi:hypothetical protein
MIKPEFYHTKVVNEILFNQRTMVVGRFKDHLIFDDACEFATEFQTMKRAKKTLVHLGDVMK